MGPSKPPPRRRAHLVRQFSPFFRGADERGAAQNEKYRRQRIHRYEMRRGAFQNLNIEQPTPNKTRLPMRMTTELIRREKTRRNSWCGSFGPSLPPVSVEPCRVTESYVAFKKSSAPSKERLNLKERGL